jgi:UDP-N-acetyl-D-glucosamine dehydrogenase
VDNFQSKSAQNILIIGAGYVGIPLAVLAAKHGKTVYLFDKNNAKCAELRSGKTFISPEIDEELTFQIKNERVKILDTISIKEVRKYLIVVICVPTPVDNQKIPDLTMVVEASRTAVEVSEENTLIILESSTYPGTTRDFILPLITNKFEHLNQSNILLAYSPERVDPGNVFWNSENTPRIVSGFNKQSLNLANNFYQELGIPTFKVDSIEIAEAAKLFENTFRLVNIAFVNEFAYTIRTLNLDPSKVLEAAYTKPFGIMKFHTSGGIGGHCIPVDPYYLTWWTRKNYQQLSIVEAAQKVNEIMPRKVADRLENEVGGSISNIRIVIAGVTYKKGIRDSRESPALGIWNELQSRGAIVTWWDPILDLWEGKERHTQQSTIPDLVVIVTSVDLPSELKSAPKVVDLNE